MKLMNATIYGFGKWYDYSIDFSKSPFLCIYGENESGKSTLQQFILFMLFGFAPKKRAFFRPKTGGPIGGRLTIFDDIAGEFTIERFDDIRNGAAKCYTSNGQDFDEEWLKERLNGMTHKTYQSIFSFSALDLSGLKEMNEEDLGEVLLGVGLTGSKDIYSIEKRIDTQIGELFKPFGKKPTINKQLDSLDELYATLTKYKDDESTYREKKEIAHSLIDDMEVLRTKLYQENQVLLSVEKQQQAIPLIHGYRNYSNQLMNYPAEIEFPEDGLNRIQALKEKILPMKSELSVMDGNQKKYTEKQTILKQELYENSVFEQGQTIIQESQYYTNIEQEITKTKETINKMEIQLENELAQLNVGLSVDELSTVNFPFHIENSWNQLKNESSQLQIEKEQLQQEYSVLTNEKDLLINQQHDVKTELLSEQRVSELYELVNEHKQQTSIKKFNEDSKKQHEKWQQMKKQKVRMSTNLLIGSIIFALLSGTGAVLLDSTILYSLLGILLVIGVGQWIFGKQSISNMEQIFLVEHEGAEGPNITISENKEAEYLLAINNQRKNDIVAIEDQIKVNDRKLLQADERNNSLILKEKRLEQKMEENFVDYPFLRNIDLQYWPQFYHTMKHLLQKNEGRIELQQQLTKYVEEQSCFHDAINRFFHDRNWESSNKTIYKQIEFIEDMVEDNRKTQALIVQYHKWIEETDEQRRALKQKMGIYEKEINALYNIANVKTEEAFFQKARKWDEKCNLERKTKELMDQLLAIFSQAEWEVIVGQNSDEHHLETKQEEHLATIKNLETDLEVKRQQLANVNADLANMETSETYSKTIHRFDMEQEQLFQLARDWAVLKTAKEMLIETKRKFRDKYLTRVIDKTSFYFSILTNRNYLKVFAPTDEQVFQVLAADELRYTVRELSQGTTDQLYVSLRIAISEVLSEKNSLPFIIDDAFVHFDASRSKQVMEILSEVAKNHQILMFTCKKDVVETENKAEIVFLENTVRIN